MDQASRCKYLPEATGEPSIDGTRQNPEKRNVMEKWQQLACRD